MIHPGRQCGQIKRLAPAQQKVSFDIEPDGEAATPRPGSQGPSEVQGARSAGLSDRLVEEHSHLRQRRQGVRGNPEPPTLVAKVCAAKGKGEIWLSGLPIADTWPMFQELNVAIQISCFQCHPEDVRLFQDEPSTQGKIVPGARSLRFELSNPAVRVGDLRKMASHVVHSLLGGDNVLVHCMTGLCRGPF